MSQGMLTPPVGPEDHAHGPANAPITLVEYGDYECPHCGRAYQILQHVLRELGDDVRFVFRNFPLGEAHPHAQAAADTQMTSTSGSGRIAANTRTIMDVIPHVGANAEVTPGG